MLLGWSAQKLCGKIAADCSLELLFWCKLSYFREGAGLNSACGKRKAGNQSNSYKADSETVEEANHRAWHSHLRVRRSTTNFITLMLNIPTPTQNLPAQAGRPCPFLTQDHLLNTAWLCSIYSCTSGDTSSTKARASNTNGSRNLNRNIQFSKYNSYGWRYAAHNMLLAASVSVKPTQPAHWSDKYSRNIFCISLSYTLTCHHCRYYIFPNKFL